MKKILGLSIAIVLIIGLVAGGTWALFSDTETSGTNVFTAGTIDIEIEDGVTWDAGFEILDMKPCETGYITFVIENVGTNPVVVWKHIKDVTCGPGETSEPEQAVDPGDTDNDIDADIWYDLSVMIPSTTMGDPAGSGWWQLIYDEDDVKIADIASENILLGMIPVGGTMEVTQSYHMDEGVGNEHQGDTMNFTIEIYGEQQTGNLVLENKSGDPDWDILQDGIQATLTYNTMGPTFDYTFEATGLQNTTDYSLIYYADPWAGDNPGALIANFTTDGSGDIPSTPGSIDLGIDLPSSPDNNFPAGAKIWLVLEDDYSATTLGDSGQMTAWNPSSYLFDTALMTYNDTDV